jgi:hypothetical protein
MRPKTDMSDRAAALLDAWAGHVDTLLDAQWDLMGGGHHWVPDPNSPLEYVRARLKKKFGPGGTWDGAEAESAGRLATLMLAVSGQHLEGIADLLRSRQVVFPVAPLARSIVESAGRTFWLIDPRIADSRDLAARVWMVRLENATRQVRTAKGWAADNEKLLETLVEAKKLLRQVEIPSRFYASEIKNNDGVITLRGQRIPGLSGGLKHVAGGMGIEDWYTPMYAFLSDATHPTPYSALETLQPAGSVEDDALHKFGSADMRREYMIYQAAVHAYQQLWWLATSYFGLDTAPVIEVCDRVNHLPRPE